MCSSSIQRLQHLIKTIVFCDRLGLASLCLLESAFCIARMVSKSQRSGGAENLRHTWKSMELTLLTRFPLCLATAPVGPWEFSVVRSLVPWQEHNVGCLACCWTCNLQPSNSNHGSQVNSRLGRGFFFLEGWFLLPFARGHPAARPYDSGLCLTMDMLLQCSACMKMAAHISFRWHKVTVQQVGKRLIKIKECAAQKHTQP